MEDFDLRKYLAEGRLLKEEIDVNKILSDGGYDIIDDEELLMTVKSRLKGKSNIDAEKLNLLVMKIEDEEGGNIDFTENKLLKEDKWVVYDTKTKKRLPNAGKIYKDRKAAQAFADKQENAEVASDTFYFDKIQNSSLDEVSAEYVNKDAYNYKVGDIIGNTVQGFDFEVIRIEGDTVTVRDEKSGKEFKTDKDNMYKGT
jgi:hypothetical protein